MALRCPTHTVDCPVLSSGIWMPQHALKPVISLNWLLISINEVTGGDDFNVPFLC